MTELRELIREINEKPEVITKIPWADETNGFEDSRIRDILMGVYPLELAKVVADCILDAFDLCFAMCDVRAMGKNPYDKNDPMLYEKTYVMFIDGEREPYYMEEYIKYLIIKLENRKGAEKIDSIVLQCCSATQENFEGTLGDDINMGVAHATQRIEWYEKEDAKRVFEICKQEGWLDDDLKPTSDLNTNWKQCALAKAIAERLNLTRYWSFFVTTWGIPKNDSFRTYYDSTQAYQVEFYDQVKQAIS